MLIDFIDKDTSTMLSNTWRQQKHDEEKKQHLISQLSCMMLSLARIPQSRIGSLRFNENGSISLASRPLFCANTILEAEGAPKMEERMYESTGQLLRALYDFRTGAFRSQPNAVYDEEDCRLQMSYMLLLQSILPSVVDLQYPGPFILQFTDLHASNIFVDADWNITGIIDLDFICSLSPDMLCMPSWLCVDDLDDISRNRGEFAASYDSFLQTFAAAEKKQQHHSTLLADTMRQAWHSGAYWVYYSFISVNAMVIMVSDHIFPIFGFESTLDEEEAFFRSLSHFWCRNSEQFVQRKMKEKVQYDLDLQNHFDTAKLTG